jgi:MarR family transcriptional regulator, transcriptional regulator for hemolysin
MDSPPVVGLLLKVHRLYLKRFEQRARTLDCTLRQCEVLLCLAAHEGVSQTRLGQLTDTEPMTLMRMLDRLESRGNLERRLDPADRRARRVYLKAKGRVLVDEIWRSMELTGQEAFSGVGGTNAALVIEILEKMQSNFALLQPLSGRRTSKQGTEIVS